MKKLLILGTFVIGSFAYTNCAMCHNGAYKESLSSMEPKEIIKIMKEYQNGIRSGSMSSIAGSMNDKDIEEVAKKYGKK